MKSNMQDKNLNNDFLYDDLDEQTLLQIDNDIAASSEEKDDEDQKTTKTINLLLQMIPLKYTFSK